MTLKTAETIMESDDDLAIWSSLEVGLDDRDRMVVQLDFVDYDDHTRDSVLYAVVDADETRSMADRLHVPTAALPKAIAERHADHLVPAPPSYVRDAFKEVLDFIIDCGARYRLHEA